MFSLFVLFFFLSPPTQSGPSSICFSVIETLRCLYVTKLNCLLRDESFHRCAINAFSDDSETHVCALVCLISFLLQRYVFVK